eukprot:XP_001700179.1 predicted protein [Chlamydomonas reinhardtii]
MRAGSRKGPSAAPEAGPAVAEDAQRYYKPSFSVDPWQQLKDAPPRVWGQEAPAGNGEGYGGGDTHAASRPRRLQPPPPPQQQQQRQWPPHAADASHAADGAALAPRTIYA